MWLMYGVMLEDSTVKTVNALGGVLYILYILIYFCYTVNKVAITVYVHIYTGMYICMYVSPY